MNPSAHIIDSLVRQEARYWKVPGLSMTVTQKGREPVFFNFGIRNKEQESVTEDTVFCIASCTKAMTSSVIAMMVTAGVLSYDEPVSSYLPGFSLADKEAQEKTTLGDILCHRTGLGAHDGLWPQRESLGSFIKRFAYLQPSGPFRQKAQYSNIMYALAGRIAEVRSGKPFAALMKEYLFDPLKMYSTTCSAEALAAEKNHAMPFQVIDGNLTELPIWNVDTVAPAASVNTTARDMAKWLDFLTRGGVAPSGKQLIAPEIFKEMITKHISFEDFLPAGDFHAADGYAFGWQTGFYRGLPILKHTGKIEGYSSLQAFLPEEGIGVALLMNLHSPSIAIFHTLLYTVLDEVLALPPIDWSHRFHGQTPPAASEYTDCYINLFAERYPDAVPKKAAAGPWTEGLAGVYVHPAYGALTLYDSENGLRMKFRDLDLSVTAYWGNLFRVEGLKEDILTYSMPLSVIWGADGKPKAATLPLEPAVSDIIFWKK